MQVNPRLLYTGRSTKALGEKQRGYAIIGNCSIDAIKINCYPYQFIPDS
jgi:hypothetical protein